MRHAFGVRGVLLFAIVGTSVSCVEVEPSVIVNETDAPVRVRYVRPPFYSDMAAPSACPLLGEPPEVKLNGEDLRLAAGWILPSTLEIDAEKCEASYVLEPGVASRLYRNGFCHDYEDHADQGAAFRPSVDYLAIEGRSGVQQWRQWEAVAQFKRSWWSGWCFLRIRE
jgi:hypothetical protein